MTNVQKRTLAAATARILPSNDGPGALEANAAGYVETALRHEVFQQGVMEWFVSHLESLQKQALELHGKDFAECDPEQQDALLRELRNNVETAGGAFFDFLISLTLEGFLGDPIHGGNRHQTGWTYIGYQLRDPLRGHALEDFENFSEKHNGTKHPAEQQSS